MDFGLVLCATNAAVDSPRVFVPLYVQGTTGVTTPLFVTVMGAVGLDAKAMACVTVVVNTF
jgi:hypothetical protein